MRFVSWNVNGLRAAVKKGFEESVAALDADIIALQETKLQEGQIRSPVAGVFPILELRRAKGIFGYGGILPAKTPSGPPWAR